MTQVRNIELFRGKLFVISLLLCLFTADTSASKSCTYRNLSNEFTKTRHQSDSKWCYAYGLADLISQKLKFNVSAVDIAFSNNYWFWSKPHIERDGLLRPPIAEHETFFHSFGYPDKAFQAVQKAGGVCPEQLISSKPEGEDGVYELLTLSATSPDSSSTFTRKEESVPHAIFKNRSIRQINEALPADINSSSWYNLAQHTCHGSRLKVPNSIVGKNHRNLSSPSPDLIEILDTQLDEKNAVLMSFDDFFTPKENMREPTPEQLKKKRKVGGIFRHGVLVIGRNFDSRKQKCMYLVRDSYGNDCRGRKNCSESTGNYWVPRSLLLNHAYEVFYLQSQNNKEIHSVATTKLPILQPK